jgi:hypothetical protein
VAASTAASVHRWTTLVGGESGAGIPIRCGVRIDRTLPLPCQSWCGYPTNATLGANLDVLPPGSSPRGFPTTKGRTRMASSSKKRTTFAKLNREQKVREKRAEKNARREARKIEPIGAGTIEIGAPNDVGLDHEVDLDKHPAVTGEQI